VTDRPLSATAANVRTARAAYERAASRHLHARTYYAGAAAVWEALAADARTHGVTQDPTSRAAQAMQHAIDQRTHARVAEDYAGRALSGALRAHGERAEALAREAATEAATEAPSANYVDERAMARAEALQALHDAALPADAPGAWIRAAIESEQLHDATLNASAAALADELECAATCTDADRDDDRRLVTCATCGETLILTEPGTITHQLDGPHIFTPAAGDDETEA
jgi:hypothetical protein